MKALAAVVMLAVVLGLCVALAFAGDPSDPRESGPEVTTSATPTAADPIGMHGRP